LKTDKASRSNFGILKLLLPTLNYKIGRNPHRITAMIEQTCVTVSSTVDKDLVFNELSVRKTNILVLYVAGV